MVEQGGRALLEQSGLPDSMWHHAVRAFCHSKNAAVSGGTSAWSRRFGSHFLGSPIPFGAQVVVGAGTGGSGDSAVFLGHSVRPGSCECPGALVAKLPGPGTGGGNVSVTTNLEIYKVKEVTLDAKDGIQFPFREGRRCGGGDVPTPAGHDGVVSAS